MMSDIESPAGDNTVGECVLLSDPSGTVVWASPAVRDVLGRSPDALVETETVQSLFGQSVPDPESVGTDPVRRTVLTTTSEGETQRVAVVAEAVDPGTAVTTYRCRSLDDDPLELGTVLERMTDAVVALDAEWRYIYANDAAVELLDTPRSTLLGEVVWDMFPTAAEKSIRPTLERAMESQEPVTTERYSETVDRWVEVRCFPSRTGLSLYFRDITERKERETALQRERDLTNQLLRVSPMGIAVHAPDGRFTRLNERAEEIIGLDREQLVGEPLNEPLWDAWGLDGEPFPDADFPFNVAVRTGEPTFGTEMSIKRRDGTRLWLSVSAAPLLDDDGAVERVIVAFEDITERKRSAQQFRAVFEGTQDALVLADDEGDYLRVNRAACDLYGLPEGELVGRNVADFAPEGYDVAAAWDAFLETETLQGEFPLVRPDGELRMTDFAATADIVPGLHLSALRDITERKAAEERLAAQRDELTRLNEINALIRDVHRTIAGATDRETIEAAVCDALVASDSYPVAMTTRRTAAAGEMRVEHAAGLSGDELAPFRSEDAPTLDPPIHRATDEDAVTVHSAGVNDDANGGPVWDLATDHGVRTVGNIPIEHDGVVYGVLTVGSTGDDAFGGGERTVFAELGQLLGKAIDAIQTKRLLYATAFLELELSVSAEVEPLAALNARAGGRWRLDGVVPVEAGRYLLYLDVGETAIEDIERVADEVAGLDHLRPIGGESERLLELRVDTDTPISGLLDAGGRIHDGRVEDGTSHFVVDVTLDTDVRRHLDRVTQRGADVDLLAKREVERTVPSAWAGTEAESALTDRQRSVLEAAHLSGYFDWPRRRTTGEELADTLDIASSTFHQHLRVATAKLLEQYFDASEFQA